MKPEHIQCEVNLEIKV